MKPSETSSANSEAINDLKHLWTGDVDRGPNRGAGRDEALRDPTLELGQQWTQREIFVLLVRELEVVLLLDGYRDVAARPIMERGRRDPGPAVVAMKTDSLHGALLRDKWICKDRLKWTGLDHKSTLSGIWPKIQDFGSALPDLDERR